MMRKRTTVLVFGVFDLLHPGHIYFLEHAKQCGDFLCVVISHDKRVLHEKKHAALFSHHERAQLVASLSMVDKVIIGEKPGSDTLVKKIRPDIICLGYDQRISLHYRGDAKIIRIRGIRTQQWKSSVIKKRMHKI